MQIIKEELQAVLEEESAQEDFYVGQVWVPQGKEDRMDDKFALKIVDVLPNTVNVEFMGNGFGKFEMGTMKMLTKDSLKRAFVERSDVFDQMTGHTKHHYTINLDEKNLVNEGIGGVKGLKRYVMDLNVDPQTKDEALSMIDEKNMLDEEAEELALKISQSEPEKALADFINKMHGKVYEGLRYHVINKTPLTENVYRVGSDAYFDLIKEARVQYKKGNYAPLNEEEKEMLESDLGEWATFRGERVPLDFPMYTETLDERKKRKKKKKKDPPIGKPMKNAGGGKKYKVYVRSKSGRIKKISYGDSKGGLKGNWNSAEARKSFASRHNCAEKKDRTKAGYWACRAHKDFGTNVPGRFW